MTKPKFCEAGLHNFDIEEYFQRSGLQVSSKDYFDAKFKYANFFQEENEKNTEYLISHDIWLTNTEKPKQITEENLDLLKNKIAIMDEGNSNWNHILWVNCKSEIVQTIEKLKDSNIEIKDIHEIGNLAHIVDDVLYFTEAGFFGIAKDMLQWHILEEYGGFVSDINFVLFRSPEDLIRTYDFFAQSMPLYGLIVTPSMIFAIKHHPVISATLENMMVKKDSLLEIYKLYPDCDLYNLTLITTYFPFLTSFYKYSNKNNTIDIAFDPQAYDVHNAIKENNFSISLSQKILSDYNFDTFECETSKEYKRYEEYLSQYEKFGICVLFPLIGVDLEENSWLSDCSKSSTDITYFLT